MVYIEQSCRHYISQLTSMNQFHYELASFCVVKRVTAYTRNRIGHSLYGVEKMEHRKNRLQWGIIGQECHEDIAVSRGYFTCFR